MVIKVNLGKSFHHSSHLFFSSMPCVSITFRTLVTRPGKSFAILQIVSTAFPFLSLKMLWLPETPPSLWHSSLSTEKYQVSLTSAPPPPSCHTEGRVANTMNFFSQLSLFLGPSENYLNILYYDTHYDKSRILATNLFSVLRTCRRMTQGL